MFHDAISSLHHAFDLPTLSTLGESLDGLAEVTEGSVLLGPLAHDALHEGVAGLLDEIPIILRGSDPFLPHSLLISLLLLTRLLLRHLSLLHRYRDLIYRKTC
jgi:hypothetical protein